MYKPRPISTPISPISPLDLPPKPSVNKNICAAACNPWQRRKKNTEKEGKLFPAAVEKLRKTLTRV